jgi:protein-S-isoprenylcysteine O-methyltransferase Ste14
LARSALIISTSFEQMKMFALKMLYAVLAQGVLFGLLLFVPAGTIDWPRAWVFIGVVLIATLLTMLYLRNSEGLINERLKGPLQKGQPLADKIVTNLLVLSFFAAIALIPLDIFRFHLMAEPGGLISLIGFGMMVGGWWLIALALHENAFATGVVKYQSERQQRVIDSGVYSKVRHPMYAGGIPFIMGSCLFLGSYAAVLLAILPITMMAVRILIEERFLQRELEGYRAYTERIRYRLIPFLW